MARIDIIAAARRAYLKSWEERGYLLRLAAVPLLIKIVCVTFASSADENASYLRFVLYMLPALLAEGWMLAHYVRLIGLGHRWPFRPSGDLEADLPVLRNRARGVLAGMIVYVLINMAIGLAVTGMSFYFAPYLPEPSAPPESADIPGHIALASLVALVLSLWAFRLGWIFIPYALNMDGLGYLRLFRGFSASIHMIGLWLICFLPFYVALAVAAGLFTPVGIALGGEQGGAFVGLIFSAVADTFKTILVAAGMTYLVLQRIENQNTGRL